MAEIFFEEFDSSGVMYFRNKGSELIEMALDMQTTMIERLIWGRLPMDEGIETGWQMEMRRKLEMWHLEQIKDLKAKYR